MVVSPMYLRRERLHSTLDVAFGSNHSVWIAGVAGAGKTTLLNAYLGARRKEVVYHHIEESDRDPTQFFARLAALTQAALGSAPAFPGVEISDPVVFSRIFWRCFWASIPDTAILFLEDAHELGDGEGAQAVLFEGAACIAGQSHCRLVVTSRDAPSQHCRQLGLRGDMFVLDDDALRLTQAEAKELGALRLGPPACEVQTELFRLTQGWVACHVLLLEHLAHGGAMPTDDGCNAPESVYEHLARQVALTLEPDSRAVINICSLLPVARADWVEQLVGATDASGIMGRISTRGLLVAAGLGNGLHVHPLLGAALQRLIATEIGQAGFAALVQRVAVFLFANEQQDDAIALVLRHGQFDLAAHWIGERAPLLVASARSGTLRRWLSALPESAIEADNWLSFWRTVIWDFGPAREQGLEAHYRAFVGRKDWTGAYSVWATLAFEHCAGVEGKRMAVWLAELEVLRELAPTVEPPELANRVAQLTRWAEVVISPGKLDARTGQDLIRHFAQCHADLPAVVMLTWQTVCYLPASAAVGLIQITENTLASHAEGSLPHLMLALCRGIGAMAQGRLRETTDHALRAIELGRELGVWAFENPARSLVIMAALTAGDLQLAQQCAAGLRTIRQGPGWRYSEGVRAYMRAYQAVVSGQWLLAQAHVDTMQALQRDLGCTSIMLTNRFISAQVQFAQGDAVGAFETLREGIRSLGMLPAPLFRATLHFLCADFALRTQDDAATVEHVREAFANARAGHFVFFPSVTHAKLERLCAFALEHEIESEFVRNIVLDQGLQPPPDRAPRAWPWALSVRVLGGLSLTTPRGAILLPYGKTRELFCALLAFGVRSVPITVICDALWPDADGDLARKSFDTTLHRLRRALPARDMIELREGRLGLSLKNVWVDIDAIESLVERMSEFAPERIVGMVQDLCRGPLLGEETAYYWLLAARATLSDQLSRKMHWICRELEGLGRRSDVILLCKLVLKMDPNQRRLHQMAQRCQPSREEADPQPESVG